ncbi:zinc transporter zip1 [Anaeramoeba flamelloides]|uniref:Zinc transporter zip1 n=1 Tax=Anaeramoeba flamelloides TaxID=1746091 RepID=A0ABQ8ZA53_9EUKA|nr:zinc transporter zip1 [Anaeramoeba flamelloides]
MKSTIVILKSIGIPIIFLFGVVGGLIPIKIAKYSQLYLSIGEAFAAGIFLGGGLVHMLSDANETLSKYYDYPVAALCCCITFLFLLFLEQALVPYLVFKVRKIYQSQEPLLVNQTGSIQKGSSGTSTDEDEGEDEDTNSKENLLSDAFDSRDGKNKNSLNKSGTGHHDHHHDHHHNHHHHHHHHHHHDFSSPKNNKKASISTKLISFILFVSLSFHSLLAGMSFGIATRKEIIPILVAILSHKASAAFSLGVSLVRAYDKKLKFIISEVLVFSLTTPIGSIIGWVMSDYSGEKIINVFLALASGSFLFVSMIEIRSSFDGNSLAIKTFATILGFTVMAILAIWS